MNPFQEPKYGIAGEKLVNRKTGIAIPDDEPVFVLRAQDRLAAEAIVAYWRRVGDNDHANAVWKRYEQFANWAKEHPDRMKSPDP